MSRNVEEEEQKLCQIKSKSFSNFEESEIQNDDKLNRTYLTKFNTQTNISRRNQQFEIEEDIHEEIDDFLVS